MPQVIRTTVYEFDELSDKAKEKAREWYRKASADDDWWSDAVLEDAYAIAELLGLDIKPVRRYDPERGITFTGFWSQGDGASFSGYFRGTEGNAQEAVRGYAPKDEDLHAIAAQFDAVWKMTGEGLTVRITQSGNYCHEYSMDYEFAHEWWAEDDLTPAKAWEVEAAIIEACRAFARWIYRQLDEAYNYNNSDEAVDENIRCNNYTFTAEGRRFG